MKIQKRCIQCGSLFTVSDEESDFCKRKGYKQPKRCKRCRKYNRDEQDFVAEELLHAVVEQELEKRRLLAQSVKFKHFDKPLTHSVKKLFVIGNGFDIWQGLKTRYSDFEKFYEKNKIDVSWNLGIEPCKLVDKTDNSVELLTQFDLLYFVLSGNFTAIDGSGDFWSDFENSLFNLDAESINGYFGKEKGDIQDIRLDCNYAYQVICKCFSEWIKSIAIPLRTGRIKYDFSESLFINFNYTSTLARLFGVDSNDVLHIHGKADDLQSIVFGHGNSVEPNFDGVEYGARFKEAYIVDTALRKFYKNPPLQWKVLCERLKNKEADLNSVEKIYILGHSLGQADAYYFKQLKKVLPQKVEWNISYFSDDDFEKGKALIKKLKCGNYKFYASIDGALETLR